MMNSSSNTESRLKAWEQIANALDKMQDEVITAKGIGVLVDVLRRQPLPFAPEEVSIAYQNYGSVAPSFISELIKVEFAPDHEKISAVIKKIMPTEQVYHYFATKKECNEANFNNYSTVLILPMQLTRAKNIGAFIIHNSKKENAYTGIIDILGRLSNRMAHLLHHNLRKRRNDGLWQNINSSLQQGYRSESEIIERVINALKEWYKEYQFYVLIRDSLDVRNFFLAYDGDKSIPNFRKEGTLEKLELTYLVGENKVLLREIEKSSIGIYINNYSNKLCGTGINSACKSWAGAALALANPNITTQQFPLNPN